MPSVEGHLREDSSEACILPFLTRREFRGVDLDMWIRAPPHHPLASVRTRQRGKEGRPAIVLLHQ
eukprot:8791820-Alexandrium_andersonii.AAC.1